ncbi:GntR family transcriptional regulator [Occultella kanbiaonis]|uniref:GntR family transcriptional regulator n=1 Tax=Occultella kanbiaonis TaxID=2675754 RepID=UPI0013D7F288|nr:GntR family transcriptional regulator [Occultella kanbiaonis]
MVETLVLAVTVDDTSPVPAYYQVYEGLRDQITANLAPGTKLPTERALATDLGVSRATLRQAFDRLERDGLLHRRQGDGTYVAEARVAHDMRFLHGFTREFASRGSRVRSRLVSMRITAAPASLRETLGVDRGPDTVIELRRVRWLDGAPASFETVWMPRERTARLLEFDMDDRSLYATLAEIGIVPVTGRETLTATVLDEYEASQLDQAEGAPAMLIERVAYDGDGTCVECVKTLLRADRFAIHTPLDLESPTPRRRNQ